MLLPAELMGRRRTPSAIIVPQEHPDQTVLSSARRYLLVHLGSAACGGGGSAEDGSGAGDAELRAVRTCVSGHLAEHG